MNFQNVRFRFKGQRTKEQNEVLGLPPAKKGGRNTFLRSSSLSVEKHLRVFPVLKSFPR